MRSLARSSRPVFSEKLPPSPPLTERIQGGRSAPINDEGIQRRGVQECGLSSCQEERPLKLSHEEGGRTGIISKGATAEINTELLGEDEEVGPMGMQGACGEEPTLAGAFLPAGGGVMVPGMSSLVAQLNASVKYAPFAKSLRCQCEMPLTPLVMVKS